jgi:hypothetical protein
MAMNAWETVALPHGIWVEGKRYNELELRAANAGDDTFLLSSGGWLPAHRTNELVSRCARLPGLVPIAPGDLVRVLVAGDLEAVLLHLHRLTFSNEFVGVFRCNAPECGESLELDLRVDALLLPPYSHASEFYVRSIEHDTSCYEVRFRLPNAGDLGKAAEFARANPEKAGERLLELCVQKVSSARGGHEIAELDQSVVDRIAESMGRWTRKRSPSSS